MALQGSGIIKLSEIQTEFTGSNPISLSEYYRDGIYVPSNNTNVPTSGAISLGQFYGAVRQFTFTISSDFTTPQDLATLAVAAGWDGSAPLVVINDAIISSNTTATPALTISGSFPAGVTLINNGHILGMGGAGGNSGWWYGYLNQGLLGTPGLPGGLALSVSSNVTIENNNIIGGGGGGGGVGNIFYSYDTFWRTGGGGGGRSGLTDSAGGNGTPYPYESPNGNPGTFASAGTGTGANAFYSHYAGNGGNWGEAGTSGTSSTYTYTAEYGSRGPWAGGAGGNAVVGNSYVTWVATGTRYGVLV